MVELHIYEPWGDQMAGPDFCSMKQQGVLLLPQDGMLGHCRVTHSIISLCLCSIKKLEVLPLPLDGMLVHHRVTSSVMLSVLPLPLYGMLYSPSQGYFKCCVVSITTSPVWDAI